MHLHIVTLNIPYPPDYGGMIDSFYRIRALHSLGVKIHLHCFKYGRKHSGELESLCESTNYYQRKTGFLNNFSLLPYIVASRRSKVLLENLTKDDYPILFDGLHTTYFINHPMLSHRKKLVRLHNIEHLYYKNLAENESNIFKKAFFIIEVYRLKRYEKILEKSDYILPISEADQQIIADKFQNTIFIPAFHSYNEIKSVEGNGDYIIYHGDLSVGENSGIADSLLRNVFPKLSFRCIIAGKNPTDKIIQHASLSSNITLVPNPDEESMLDLIKNAHINILPAKSANGFKLKILSALFAGRHCVVNSIIADSYPAVRDLCQIADSDEEIITKLNQLMTVPFTAEMIHTRKYFLNEQFNVKTNAKKLVDIVLVQRCAEWEDV
jgi:hypothetical protein